MQTGLRLHNAMSTDSIHCNLPWLSQAGTIRMQDKQVCKMHKTSNVTSNACPSTKDMHYYFDMNSQDPTASFQCVAYPCLCRQSSSVRSTKKTAWQFVFFWLLLHIHKLWFLYLRYPYDFFLAILMHSCMMRTDSLKLAPAMRFFLVVLKFLHTSRWSCNVARWIPKPSKCEVGSGYEIKRKSGNFCYMKFSLEKFL